MTKAVEEKLNPGTRTAASGMPRLRTGISTGPFKYYIHDTAEGYRLQLLGDLTDPQVSELNCCWSTARNTLHDRKLILDLRGLKSVDERGKQWLAGMGLEGASFIPESFLRSSLAGDAALRDQKIVKFTIFDRLLSALRGCASPAE